MDGTPFGRYRLIELLGQGGMGDVWRAFDTATNRVVAVKVLPARLAADPTFEQRFRREAFAAASLNEPHIVPIHNFGEINGRLYVDMRLVEGLDLQEVLAKGALGPDRAVAIVGQVASALNAAHKIGLVHRDVKPSNILLADEDFAYLIDFGIARATGDTGLTGTGSVIGTWHYMAPERFTTGQADIRSDIYALACVLYECLTCNHPFPGNTVEQQIAAHLNSPPPRPSVTHRGVSPQLDAVIAAGMAKNPDHRFASTVELARAAKSALTGPVTVPGPPQPPPPPTAPMRPMTTPPPAPPQGPSGSWSHPHPQEQTSATPAGVSNFAPTQYGASGGQPPSPPLQPPRWTPPGGGPAAPTPSRPWWKHPAFLVAAVLAIIAVVATTIVLVTKSSGSQDNPPQAGPSGPTTPPARPKGPLDGTFTAELASETTLDGTPRENAPGGKETWVFESTCAPSGCVATATKSAGSKTDSSTLVLDQLDGRWLAVNVASGNCKSATDDEWEMFSLEQRPDGTLAGDYSYIFPTSGCSGKLAMTLTPRSGAPAVTVADPTTQQPYVRSAAAALYGRYTENTQYPNNSPRREDYTVQTWCLRTSPRCLSYFSSPQGHRYFLFAGDKWTRADAAFDDDSCPNGGNRHVEITEEYPLPQPPQDPIQRLNGGGHQVTTGTCPFDSTFTSTFTRTGN